MPVGSIRDSGTGKLGKARTQRKRRIVSAIATVPAAPKKATNRRSAQAAATIQASAESAAKLHHPRSSRCFHLARCCRRRHQPRRPPLAKIRASFVPAAIGEPDRPC